jgi:hypothetical protein
MVNCAEPSLIEFGGENDIELNVLKVACGSAHTVAITGKDKREFKILRNIKLTILIHL